MTDFLKAKDLTQKQFLNLIANFRPDSDKSPCYIWLEAPDGWAFDRWEETLHWCRAGYEPVKAAASDCLKRSTAGRLFARTGELRWRTIPALGTSCWRTVFLGSSDWAGTLLGDHSGSLQGLQPERESFFLWGQQTPMTRDEWIELRIPHRFRYPIPSNPDRVKVVVEQWKDDTGKPHFVRLCGLEPYQEEEK